jgi:hypothetical protein
MMSNPLNLSDFSALRQPQYGLIVGLPTLGSHRTEFTFSLMQGGFPINCIGQYLPVMGHMVGEARNMIAHSAKQVHAKYLLFVDEDVLSPANAYRKLVWDLDNNPHISVVSGVYGTKSDPVMPLVFDGPGAGPSYDWHVGDFRAVYAIGMGITIIRVADLVKLDAVCGTTIIDDWPAAGFNTEVVEYFKDGTAWIQDGTLPTGGWAMTFTEDMYFCMKAHDVGLNVFVDASIMCGHIDGAGTVYTLNGSRPTLPVVDGSKPIYFDLGSGAMQRCWVDGNPMLRVDLDPALKPDFVQDVRHLDIKDGIADGVSAIHVIEHMSRHDAETMMDEMVRILKPGSSLVIACPDMKAVAEYYIKQGQLNDHVLRSVFGWQVNEFQYHKSGWDADTLTYALKRRGCTVTEVKRDAEYLLLEVWARKGQPATPEFPLTAPADMPDGATRTDIEGAPVEPSQEPAVETAKEGTESGVDIGGAADADPVAEQHAAESEPGDVAHPTEVG